MKTVLFNTPEAAFNFTQKELKEQIESKLSSYEIDETKKILNVISNSHQETVVITEDQVFFDIIALNLIGAGKGTALCKSCNETYQAKDLNTIIIGSGRSPLDIQREKQSLFSRLFTKKRKPISMFGGSGYECPEGHSLISVTWKTF